MIKPQHTLGIIFCLLISTCFSNQLDQWQSHWEKGAHLYNEKDFPNALKEYNAAIDLRQNETSQQLYLFNERGLIYNLLQEYQKAIEDFTLVINTPNAKKEDVVNALCGRTQAYLVTKKFLLFEKDVEQLNQMGEFYTIIEDSDMYYIVQLQGRSRYDKLAKEAIIKTAQMQYNIRSENKILTPTDILILRK